MAPIFLILQGGSTFWILPGIHFSQRLHDGHAQSGDLHLNVRVLGSTIKPYNNHAVSIREFPTIGGPNMDPKRVGLLL